MHAGDADAVGGDLVEQAQAGLHRLLRINVEDEGDVGPGQLQEGHVDRIAPDDQTVAAALDDPGIVPRRVAGRFLRVDAGQELAVADARRALGVRRHRCTRADHVGALALMRGL